jgi:hypothetical protein
VGRLLFFTALRAVDERSLRGVNRMAALPFWTPVSPGWSLCTRTATRRTQVAPNRFTDLDIPSWRVSAILRRGVTGLSSITALYGENRRGEVMIISFCEESDAAAMH